MSEYYTTLTDEEIEQRIKELSPKQVEKFNVALVLSEDRRRALFVASSYPREEK